MMRSKTNGLLLGVLLVLLVVPFATISQVEAQDHNDLTGVKVAVYDGGLGVSSDPRESSMAALYWMFRWMNATVEIVNASAIRGGVLDDFQLIAVPGGYAYNYHLDLGYSGKNAIRNYVEEGGSYWGSCAGAFYALEEFEWSEYGETTTQYYGLGLFPGRGVGPIIGIADWPNFAMTDVQINTTNELIDLSQEPSNHSIMYYGGPYFETEGMEGITTLATYSYNGMPAMIAFEYGEGNGRVFLTGPHPEWEEDSYRDGSLWDNNLDENGSEWELCKTVSLWLASVTDEPSGPSPDSDLTLTIILIVGIGVIALVVLSIWSSKR
ncbi:MAG: BPL-N domain-containing protein [Candidatus Thorarchaeota archaeon]|jgi:glutamine amidotransferase-like uncharacterized protein